MTTPQSHHRYIIKVCGVTTEEDALAATEFGATAIGFNFYPRSPRHITLAQASQIGRNLPEYVWRVGVFVNPTAADLQRIAGEIPLDVVQIHGAFPSEQLGDLRVWRAVPVDSTFAPAVLTDENIEAYLLDAPTPLYGGSGTTFDWSRVKGMTAPFLLAGGLDPSNVGAAISLVRPWGVDACSALESEPGKKDHQKLRDFIEAAERAFEALDEIVEFAD
jgi:phosphoribosylanthranilate isomerase